MSQLALVISEITIEMFSLLKSFTCCNQFCFTSGLGNQILSARSPLYKVTTLPLIGGDAMIDNNSLLTLLPVGAKEASPSTHSFCLDCGGIGT